jgi:processive 1,2-diacylglycerol beta-glucosyltransferase
MSHRLLVLSASIGAGHAVAAEALCRTYEEKFGGVAYHVDFLRYTHPYLSRTVEQAYYLVTKHTPSIWKLIYNMGGTQNVPIKRFEKYIGLRKYREMIEKYRPDAIIATHFLPAAIVSYLYPNLPIPNGVVLTDYVSHQLWVNPNTEVYFVAHPAMKEELMALGVDESRIKVTGIPVRPCFINTVKSQAHHATHRTRLRAKLHIDRHLPLILIMCGGNAVGPLAEVLEELNGISGENFQVIVITGRNRKSYRELKQALYNTNLKGQVRGNVRSIHEYMACADLLISKAGGLTVTEALITGLPILVIRPTPGQEDGNTAYVTQEGAGIYIKDIRELSSTVLRLLEHPAQLTAMSRNAKTISRPQANDLVLTEIEQLVTRNRMIPVIPASREEVLFI